MPGATKPEPSPPPKSGAVKAVEPPGEIRDGLGYWSVASEPGEDGYMDIIFTPHKSDPPEPQLELKNDIERTLSSLRAIFPIHKDSAKQIELNERKYREFFSKLLGLAQVGLAGVNADPKVARGALNSLHHEIVDREAGRIKNDYMVQLGWPALVVAALSGILYLIYDDSIFKYPDEIYQYRHIFLVWTGCMAGTWASFAARKVVLQFNDLAVLEEDRIQPLLRLIFVLVLTTILVLIFTTGLVEVTIGGFTISSILTSGSTALLTGALAGLSEMVLPAAVKQSADKFIASASKS